MAEGRPLSRPSLPAGAGPAGGALAHFDRLATDLRSLGVRQVLAPCAVGGLRNEVEPGDLAVPDQLVDRTSGRARTYVERGAVHLPFADPYCPRLSEALGSVDGVRRGATMVVIDGPRFSTRAESEIYRSHGVDVIGMTNLTEARLAREAEICYASLSMITDYDCWHETEEAVSGEGVMEVIQQNSKMSQDVVRQILARLDPAAERIRHQVVGERADQRVLVIEQRLPQAGRARQFGAVIQPAGGVHRDAVVLDAPRTDDVEVVERQPERVDHAMAGVARRILAVHLHAFARRQGAALVHALGFFEQRHVGRRRRRR